MNNLPQFIGGKASSNIDRNCPSVSQDTKYLVSQQPVARMTKEETDGMNNLPQSSNAMATRSMDRNTRNHSSSKDTKHLVSQQQLSSYNYQHGQGVYQSSGWKQQPQFKYGLPIPVFSYTGRQTRYSYGLPNPVSSYSGNQFSQNISQLVNSLQVNQNSILPNPNPFWKNYPTSKFPWNNRK